MKYTYVREQHCSSLKGTGNQLWQDCWLVQKSVGKPGVVILCKVNNKDELKVIILISRKMFVCYFLIVSKK